MTLKLPEPDETSWVLLVLVVSLLAAFDGRGTQSFCRNHGKCKNRAVHQSQISSEIEKLREQVKKKRPELWNNNMLILHQDNAPAHDVLLVKQFLADKKIPVLDHPPSGRIYLLATFTCFLG